MKTPFSPAALQVLAAVMDFTVDVAGNATCTELKFADTPEMRVFLQEVIGDEFTLNTERGKIVVGADDVAGYFRDRAKALQSDASESAASEATPTATQPASGAFSDVLAVIALVKQQMERFQPAGKPDYWAYVAGTFDELTVTHARAQLAAEYRQTWTLHVHKNEKKDWAFNIGRV